MPRVVALLSFYDETPAELHRLIASLHLGGVNHLICLDGRYLTFRGDHDTSHHTAHEAIMDACDMADMPLTLHVEGPWDSEIAKRNFLFAMGEKHTGPDDWYAVVDGDEEFAAVAGDISHTLDTTTLDVATVTLEDQRGIDPAHRMYFRALRGLHVTGNHYTYRTQDGRNLWGHAMAVQLEPAQPLRVLVTHHPRDAKRRTDKLGYYIHRNATGMEGMAAQDEAA